MAYDVQLAGRIRDLVGGEPGVGEKQMIGGLAVLVVGTMAVSVSGEGGLLVRIDPALDESDERAARARPFEMGGRRMSGWRHVDAEALATDEELRWWVDRGVARARSLPPR
ncbi:MAG: TfoX/Sxy family protein [Rhodoferax sp.]|nr:TfoX/Sxy family protein [Actinomycetota bacterium]